MDCESLAGFAPLLAVLNNWNDYQVAVTDEVPDSPGVYVFCRDSHFGRLSGTSDILYIGKTSERRGLMTRILDYNHPTTPHEERIRGMLERVGFSHVRLRWKPTTEYDAEESGLLGQYEAEHWELPPGNRSQPGI